MDLKTEIDAAVGIARNELAHRARLEVLLPERLPAVRGAPRDLGQVFMNLLVNAAHAIPEGHAQENVIRIAARVEGRWWINVFDASGSVFCSDGGCIVQGSGSVVSQGVVSGGIGFSF